MIVTLLSVWRAARARSVPFTAETAGYLMLLAAEDLALGPRTADLASLVLTPDGGLCVGGSDAADALSVEAALRVVLGQLLEVTSSPGPALQRAVTRPPTGNLTAFAAELSKALIPMNRAAARRGVVRLFRETERAIEAGHLAPTPKPRAPAHRGVATPRPTSIQEAARECTPGPAAVASATVRIAPLVDPFYVEPEPTRPATTAARRRLGLPAADAELTDRVPEVGELNDSERELDLDDLEELGADVISELPPVAGPGPSAAPRDTGSFALDPAAAETPFQPYVGMPAQRSDVHDLLEGFRVSEPLTERDVRRELRALADMDATPPPAANDRRR